MNDGRSDDPVLLARAPRAVEFLRELARRPKKRALGNHSGAFLRTLGLIDDEVLAPDGKRLTASEAIESYGEAWYTQISFTGRERITAKGKSELAKLKKRD